MESMGVVVRRYIDFLLLLIPTPLVSALFCSSIPTFCSFKKCFRSLYIPAELMRGMAAVRSRPEK